MKSTFKVVACSPSNGGKTFVWKLEISNSQVIFGITKIVKRTYYIGAMPAAVKVGTEMEEDLSRFEVIARPFTPDPTVDEPEPETIMLKWLHVKQA